jgi:predicted nucleotidyltransferase
MQRLFVASVIYHDVFNYPLTKEELRRWKTGKNFQFSIFNFQTGEEKGYFFKKGRNKLITLRLKREKISARKFEIAQKAAKVLSLLPTIKFIAVTGSLAMRNADRNSDIDLLIITQEGALWISRLISLTSLIPLIRRSGDKNQKDKLCLNMWLTGNDLIWSKDDRNVYTAHEIAQIVPLVNKDFTYERFLSVNKWILDWWPNAAKVQSAKCKVRSSCFLCTVCYALCAVFEQLAFWLQYQYMKSKITREVVTPTRAIFHPNDVGKEVLDKLRSYLLK